MNKPSGKLAYANATIANLEEKISRLEEAQPSPVAVVLPDRLSWSGIAPAHIRNHVKGWNACLDELKRINPSL